MWTGIIEKFAVSKSMDLNDDGNASEMIFADGQSITSTFPPGEQELEDMHHKAEHMIISLTKELNRLKDLTETSKGSINSKTSWKDCVPILASVSDATINALTTASAMQKQLQSYGQGMRLYRDRQQAALSNAESSLQSSVADNNKIRKRIGLDPVSPASYAPHSAASSMLHLAETGEKTGSYSSSVREVFFDAEGWDSREDDEGEDDDSIHEAEDDGGDAYDEEDDASNTSTPNTNTPKLSRHGSSYFLSRQSSVEVEVQNGVGNETSVTTKSQVASMVVAIAPPRPVLRRTRLPAPTVSMQNISIMSILRNNVGKDLSTVAMPIALNEPINLLQKLCEELEYCELLDQAAGTADPVQRLCLIAAFAVSGYASTIHRAGRKPFNPLLGETYECLREDKGFKFVSEKVSHHPPIMACHAQAHKWLFFQDSQVKTKFWGKSMELIPSGTVHLDLPEVGEYYTWGKVTTCMRNVFSTGRYLEHYGTMKITAQRSGHYCELTFRESGYFSSAKNEVVGTIFGPSGEKLLNLSGHWDKTIQKFHQSSPNSLEVIWRARPNPVHTQDMYGFTQFAVELNELTPDLEGLLPNTDTRYRPDQRMYEEGRSEEAEQEKLRLEQKQREYRKQLELQGVTWTPQWFEQRPEGNETSWRYKGGYWESRGKFEHKIDLW
ncbi:hypothetical protein HK104_004958 [Borealophlyctis nickersoniae]|nr:hypothetical protein HK104_004958 [Borealophlyctis nickersoniae]